MAGGSIPATDEGRMGEQSGPWLCSGVFSNHTSQTFSTKEQSYPVSDCTSEALKAVILLQKLPCVRSPKRLTLA